MTKLQQLRDELSKLDQRRLEVVAEIQKLQESRIKPDANPKSEGAIDAQSSEAEKTRLFRELFSGRDDVFPLRFESRKSGRSGYQPACKKEWRAGICFKPQVKCAKCECREFIPVSDAVVRQHLSGKDQTGKSFVMEIYPLRMDETCSFLAVDFDKAEWQHDASAFLDVCNSLNIPAFLEQSRSGNGGHVWIFFDEPVLARLARKLGSFILTTAMNDRARVGIRFL